MKTFIFKNQSGIDVRYKADIIGNQKGAFTVMEIQGLDTVEEQKLLLFKQLNYNYPEFKKFAQDNNLTLLVEEPSVKNVENLEHFNVTFDADGGTPEPEAQVVDLGGLVLEPEEVTKESFSLTGWSEDDGETIWNFAVDKVSSRLTLKAIWVEEFSVTFDTDGGLEVPEVQTVLSRELATEPTAPTKEGFVFDGWSIDEGVTIWDFENEVTSDITLKAVWSTAE